MLHQAQKAIREVFGAEALQRSRLSKYIEVLFRVEDIAFAPIPTYQPRNGLFTAYLEGECICKCGQSVTISATAKDNRYHLLPGEGEETRARVRDMRRMFLAFRIIQHESCLYELGDYWTDAQIKEEISGREIGESYGQIRITSRPIEEEEAISRPFFEYPTGRSWL